MPRTVSAGLPLAALIASLALTAIPASGATGDPAGSSGTTETVAGELRHLIIDGHDGRHARLTVIDPQDGGAWVVVRSPQLDELATGTTVSAAVPRDRTDDVPVASLLNDATPAAPLATGVHVVAPPAGTTSATPQGLQTYARKVAVVHGRFSGQASDGTATSTVTSWVTGDTNRIWSGSTAGKVTFSLSGAARTAVAPFGPAGTSDRCTTSHVSEVFDWAVAVSGQTRPSRQGRHTLVYTPTDPGCRNSFAGIGELADGGVSWINGQADPTYVKKTVAHELTHNLSIGHANSRIACQGGVADGTEAQCTHLEYGNGFSIMGMATGSPVTVPEALDGDTLDRLGLLPAGSVTRLGGSATLTLQATASLTGMRYATFTDGGLVYRLEHRGAVRSDAGLGTTRYGSTDVDSKGDPTSEWLHPGLLVMRTDQPTTMGKGSTLLDAGVGDPAARADDPPYVLLPNRTFTTASGVWTVKVLNRTATSTQVRVERRATSVSSVAGGTKSGTSWVTRTRTPTITWATSSGAGLTGVDVLVNGVTVGRYSGATTSASFAARLAEGTNTVRVVARYAQGRTVGSSTTVVVDSTAPVFTKRAKLGLRTGTATSTSAPTTLSWKVSDRSGLAKVATTAPSSRRKTFATSTTSWKSSVRTGKAVTWALAATDRVGHTATSTTRRTASLVSETKAKRSSGWSRVKSSKHLGRSALRATRAKASMTYRFTGRSIAWVATKAKKHGKAYVYLDGKKVKTIDLRASRTKTRQVVFAKNFSSSKKHTIKIVVVGTKGRPTVMSDGFVVLR